MKEHEGRASKWIVSCCHTPRSMHPKVQHGAASYAQLAASLGIRSAVCCGGIRREE